MTRGVPLVLVDRLLDGLASDAVVLDNELAAQQAVEHLITAGHTRIAALVGDQKSWTMRKRRAGFLAVMSRAGLAALPDDVVPGPLTFQTGRLAINRLLARPVRPSAVVCFNYELTVGALIAINDHGIAMPEELSFVGFDSMELARVTRPRLAMITQPTRQIAAQAAALMHTRLLVDQSPRMHSVVTLASEFEPGGSVGPPG
jgi:LacI family transcriptional regulator